MGITRGGLHDFDDSKDFKNDKLENKLGKSARIGGNKSNRYVPNYEEEQTAREIRRERFYETSKEPPKEDKKPAYWTDNIYEGAPQPKTKKKWWQIWK